MLVLLGVSLGVAYFFVQHGGLASVASMSRPAAEEAKIDDARPQGARSGVFVMRASARDATGPTSSLERRAQDEFAQPVPVAFSFLGRIAEGDATVIVLHGDGRTFNVRGTGLLDEDYRVEAVYDDHVVIRYLPLDSVQVVALAARQYPVPESLRGEYPQD
jgi:hypothetical protein